MRVSIISLIFTLLAHSVANAGVNSIHHKLSKLKLKKQEVSIIVQEVGKSKSLVSINPRTMRTPASVSKILTTYASLLHLGSNYRWPTEFYTTGKINNGTLAGDLVVKGYGNPSLSTEDLDDIVSALHRKGIKRVKGNLIIDQSYFKVSSSNWTHFDKNIYSPYNATPSAFMFNYHAVRLEIRPDRKRNRVSVYRDFPDYSYSIVNKIKPVRARCRGRYAYPKVSLRTNKSKKVTVYFSGKFSTRCGKRKVYKVLTSATNTFYAGLRQKMRQMGGRLEGKLLIKKRPRNSRLIYTHKSDKLINIISKINKKSNNVMAKQALLTLGAKIYGKQATVKMGARAVKNILRKHRLVDKNIRIDNGSGLSRKSKINATSLVRLLNHGYHSKHKWLNTLSVVGKDGTLKNRLKYSKVRNKAWMKTGSLNRVSSVAGYIRAKSGKTYILVMMVNCKRARYKGLALQDYLIRWVYG